MVTIQPFGPAKGRVSNDSVATRRATTPHGGWTAEKRDGIRRVDVLRWPILNVNSRKDGVRGQQQPLANCDTERKTEEDEWVSVEEAHWTFTDQLAIYTHCKPVCLIDAYQYTRRMVDDALSLLMAVYVAYTVYLIFTVTHVFAHFGLQLQLNGLRDHTLKGLCTKSFHLEQISGINAIQRRDKYLRMKNGCCTTKIQLLQLFSDDSALRVGPKPPKTKVTLTFFTQLEPKPSTQVSTVKLCHEDQPKRPHFAW